MGSVIEGVCGYKRPQYNIWGHAVDMARKLELTGKMNNIQVTDTKVVLCSVELSSL